MAGPIDVVPTKGHRSSMSESIRLIIESIFQWFEGKENVTHKHEAD